MRKGKGRDRTTQQYKTQEDKQRVVQLAAERCGSNARGCDAMAARWISRVVDVLSRKLGELLVSVMVETRDWNPTACREAVQALTEKAPGLRPASVTRIVGNYVSAENEQGGAYFTSPKLLPEPGPHWDKTEYANRPIPPRCPEHQLEYPCEACDSRDVTRDLGRLKALRQQAWTETAPDRQATRQALTGRNQP